MADIPKYLFNALKKPDRVYKENVMKPEYILTFGINKGYSLAEIYHYDPNYIEWLIMNLDWFRVDVYEFYALPKLKLLPAYVFDKEENPTTSILLWDWWDRQEYLGCQGHKSVDYFKKCEMEEEEFYEITYRFCAEVIEKNALKDTTLELKGYRVD